MIRVALTGNIGSGKSTVSKIFESLKVPVFIADKEARLLYLEQDVKEEVNLVFGSTVFNENGEANLKKLADIVFNDKSKLLKINHIIHPRTLAKYKHWLEENKTQQYTIHESAILFENNLQHHFDKIITVFAPFELRLKRVMERDEISREKIIDRIQNQMSDEEKNKLADFVIINDGIQLLIPQVIDINNKLKNC